MMTELKNEINRVNNLGVTENGAVGYKNSVNPLTTLNFQIPSMRNGVNDDIKSLFRESLETNFEYTVKWLFFIRDIREGLGERDTFVRLYQVYFDEYPEQAKNTLSLVSEYGRWKDVVDIAFGSNCDLKNFCFKIIKNQLSEDIVGVQSKKSISLLAKWMPSINASKKARVRAIELIKYLGMNNCSYRKMLSKLREYIDVLERKTCLNKWEEIDYNKVCSNANLRYSNAFMKHDSERRREYLESLLNPNSGTKMNASVLYPHEIWHKYCKDIYSHNIKKDDALESMWSNLKEMGDCGNTMVVVDGSGSMAGNIPYSSIRAIDVSRSLGVYFAERCTGEFHNKMIEFSADPQFIDIDGKDNLCDKISHMNKFTDCTNTNIEAVFNMILKTAEKYNIPQSDMPERILIVSDMEFDYATTQGGWSYDSNKFDWVPLFEGIKKDYDDKGYKLPKLVFWNVNSRTNTIPLNENKAGVILVSGFSVNTIKMVMSNNLDPWEVLKETLDSDRYKIVDEKIKI